VDLTFITIRKLEGIRFLGFYFLIIFLKPTKKIIGRKREKEEEDEFGKKMIKRIQVIYEHTKTNIQVQRIRNGGERSIQ